MVSKKDMQAVVKLLEENEADILANEASIYYKMLEIYSEKGKEKAWEYFLGTHCDDDYKDFLREE